MKLNKRRIIGILYLALATTSGVRAQTCSENSYITANTAATVNGVVVTRTFEGITSTASISGTNACGLDRPSLSDAPLLVPSGGGPPNSTGSVTFHFSLPVNDIVVVLTNMHAVSSPAEAVTITTGDGVVTTTSLSMCEVVKSGNTYTSTTTAASNTPGGGATVLVSSSTPFTSLTVTNTANRNNGGTVVALCSSSIATVPLQSKYCTGADADGDVVADACDLDNDNDGILDVNEGVLCTELSYQVGWRYNDLPQTREPYVTDPGIVSSASNSMNGAGISGSYLTLTPSESMQIPGTDLDQTTLAGAIAQNDYIGMSFTTAATLPGDKIVINGTKLWVEEDDYYSVDPVPDASQLMPYQFTLQISTDPTFATGVFDILHDETVSYQGERGMMNFYGSGYELAPSTTYYLRYYLYNVQSSSNIIIFDDQDPIFTYCTYQDTNADGTPDYLDLDSDGDGCFDSLEGDGGFALSDIDADGVLQGGVDANGVPIAAAGGQGVGTSQDAGAESAECASLPVTLLSFAVQKSDNGALVQWETVSEMNSKGFEIERSSNAKIWIRIGEEHATGESSQLVKYYFTDTKPLSGTNYYRLKMVDKDNSFAYSSIRSVEFKTGNRTSYIYPNPSSGIIRLDNSSLLEIVSVEIANTKGVTVYNSNTAATPVSQDGIDVRYLKNGIYILKVTYKDGSQYTHKVVINK